MNQFVRPLPFATISDLAAVAGAPPSPEGAGVTPDEASTDFDELLDSEIQEDDVTAEVKEPKPADAWTLYAFGAAPAQILADCPLVPVNLNGKTTEQGSEGELSGMPELDLAPPAQRAPDKAALEGEKPSLNLVQLVRPARHNVPLPAVSAGLPHQNSEQIASKAAETSKKAGGIPVAEDPAMLRPSEKQEKSAEKQSLSLSAEVSEGSGVDTAVQVRAANQFRDSAPKRDADYSTFPIGEAVQREWSSFDGISESVEIQSSQQVESTDVLEAIRGHVELLKTSNQQKLEVVLRPDGRTEIRLQVENVNGEILLQARCERGDFARLESNWSAIQQSLANQGVRVEPLQHSGSFQQNNQSYSGSSASPDQRSHSEQEREAITFEQEMSVPNRPKKLVAQSTAARGWQSWA